MLVDTDGLIRRLRGDAHVARFLRRCLVTRPIWSPCGHCGSGGDAGY
jgi:hypothetical protein